MTNRPIEIPCVLMRGGTSKGLYFLKKDLPEDAKSRDEILLAVMGSPDPHQIDGLGGAHPVTSKVAIISKSDKDGVDVDYLFLQVKVELAEVSDGQNCGNILAGVGPFAIENGLVDAKEGETDVRIRMLNSGAIAIAKVQTPARQVIYHGDAKIDGVPSTAAPIMLDFQNIAGATCGHLLPSSNVIDIVDGVEVTCIDNGMPIAIINASDFGKTGQESPADLEADSIFKHKVESIRLKVGSMMNLGDVSDKTIPKMTLISPPKKGGSISSRSLIPHRVHQAIGVLAATSVAAACLIPGTVANKMTKTTQNAINEILDIEHPTGSFSVNLIISSNNKKIIIKRSALLRTARKLMQGTVFVNRPLDLPER